MNLSELERKATKDFLIFSCLNRALNVKFSLKNDLTMKKTQFCPVLYKSFYCHIQFLMRIPKIFILLTDSNRFGHSNLLKFHCHCLNLSPLHQPSR